MAAAQTTGGTFQTTFINAVANTLGVASTAVTVTAVASAARRQLLQTGIIVYYNVATTASGASIVQATLSTGASSITSQMATTYPGISVSAPVVSTTAVAGGPTMAPSKVNAATHVSHINVMLMMGTIMMSLVGITFFAI